MHVLHSGWAEPVMPRPICIVVFLRLMILQKLSQQVQLLQQ